MTLLACIAAIIAGFGLAAVLRRLCQSLASAGTTTWGYYVSGAFFALMLIPSPVFVLMFSNDQSRGFLGLPRAQGIQAVFLGGVLLFWFYLVVAKRLRYSRMNPPAMSVITAGFTALAVVLNMSQGPGFDVLQTIVLSAILLALLPSQVALGKVHAQFEPE